MHPLGAPPTFHTCCGNGSSAAALPRHLLCPALQVDNFTSWLEGKKEEQAKLAAHEDPAFKSDEVDSWLVRLQKVGGHDGEQFLGAVATNIEGREFLCRRRMEKARPVERQAAPPFPMRARPPATCLVLLSKSRTLPSGLQPAEQPEEAQATAAAATADAAPG